MDTVDKKKKKKNSSFIDNTNALANWLIWIFQLMVILDSKSECPQN